MKSLEDVLSGVIDPTRMMWISQARFSEMSREVRKVELLMQALKDAARENVRLREEIERLRHGQMKVDSN